MLLAQDTTSPKIISYFYNTSSTQVQSLFSKNCNSTTDCTNIVPVYYHSGTSEGLLPLLITSDYHVFFFTFSITNCAEVYIWSL